VLVLTTLGALVFVSFFHLQKGAPRYLFPIFPIAVVGSVLTWGSLINDRIPGKSRHAYLAVAAFMLASFVATGSFRIPFKHHGDSYENPDFSPSPGRSIYANFKSAPVFVRENASAADLILASKYQFFFLYAGYQADFDLKMGGKSKPEQLSAYMSTTRQLNTCNEVKRAITKRGSRNIWFSVYSDEKTEKCIQELAKKYSIALRYQDAKDRSAKVYQLTQ
jgi:hypothetical protein